MRGESATVADASRYLAAVKKLGLILDTTSARRRYGARPSEPRPQRVGSSSRHRSHHRALLHVGRPASAHGFLRHALSSICRRK
jgi:hypothetical protein